MERFASPEQCADRLVAQPLPVLRASLDGLAELAREEPHLVPRDIARLVLRDALFALRVLRHVVERPRGRLWGDITTVEHAVMMTGVAPFLKTFSELPCIDAVPGVDAEAREGLARVLSRSRHAALYAYDWALQRRDIEPEEIMVAALLCDLAEALLWCFAPAHAARLRRAREADEGTHAGEIEKQVCGFELTQLHKELLRRWKLPGLVQVLHEPSRAGDPRVKTVWVAARLARHSAAGWHGGALAADLADASALLQLAPERAWQRIRDTALAAAEEWTWYGVQPLPGMLLPGEELLPGGAATAAGGS